MHNDITTYNEAQTGENRKICELLADEIHSGLPDAENKVWHGAPVWFLKGNPIVGYAVRRHDIQLLFWSGQGFEDSSLQPEGSFKAAQAHYTELSQINPHEIQRWLQKARTIQWDYKNIAKRQGELVRLEAADLEADL